MKILDSVSCGDDYTLAATLEDVFQSNGGYFAVTGNDCYAKLAYGNRGQVDWTPEVHVPIGNGQLYPGTVGIQFRNYTQGATSVVSAALSTKNEPVLSIGAGGNATVAPSGVVAVLARDPSAVNVVSTTVETNLCSLTIPAGTLSVDSMLRLTVIGDWLYNRNTGDRLNLRIYFGGTKIWDSGTLGGATLNANRHPYTWMPLIPNLNSLSSNMLGGFMVADHQTGPSPTPTTGIGAFQQMQVASAVVNVEPAGGAHAVGSPLSIDTSVAVTLAVTAQWSGAGSGAPANSFRKWYAALEQV